jgi:hypothetical protein
LELPLSVQVDDRIYYIGMISATAPARAARGAAAAAAGRGARAALAGRAACCTDRPRAHWQALACTKAAGSRRRSVAPPLCVPTMLRLPLPTVLLLLLQTLGGAVAEDWKARRSELVRHLFGTDGSLPARSQPDFIEAVPGPQAQGCLCAARGHCNTTECQWDNNMTKLTWTLESKLPTESKVKGVFNNASGSYIRLNSTVFHTLNTSTSAPAYHGWSAMMPKDGDGGQPHIYPTQQTRTLVLFHQGHDVPHDVCQTDNNGEVEWLNTLGYDVMELEMPFLGCNWHEGLPEEDHVWFQQVYTA